MKEFSPRAWKACNDSLNGQLYYEVNTGRVLAQIFAGPTHAEIFHSPGGGVKERGLFIDQASAIRWVEKNT
jgi:hypothetical protein